MLAIPIGISSIKKKKKKSPNPESRFRKTGSDPPIGSGRKTGRDNIAGNTCQQLKFIDAVQGLGLAYHFEIEIEQVLQHIHDNYLNGDDMEGDIYNVALQFRLLRQAGYNISCGKNPKDNYHV